MRTVFRAMRSFVGGTRCARGAWRTHAAWARPVLRSAAVAALALLLGACVGHEHMSFLAPQGPIAHAESVHFYWVVGIMAVFVAGPIFLELPFLVWHYRYGNKSAHYLPKWRDNAFLTTLTWTGPVLIVCALGFFVWTDSHRLSPWRPIASSQPPLEIQVVGYDWKWLFIYPGQGIATIGTLALPVGRPVTLHITSATVMQSFFIPALGSQIYAMGGMVTRLNLEASHAGRYLGENTMYNGNGFHDQKFTAVGMRPGAFKAWVRQVRFAGTPIDARIFAAIGQRTTRGQLIAGLPGVASSDGTIYLTGLSAAQFPAIVRAVKDGTPPRLVSAPRMRPAPRVAALRTPARAGAEAKP